nr:MAG TPA: hypothetical protein [Caudoviricetes sp.]
MLLFNINTYCYKQYSSLLSTHRNETSTAERS